MTDIEVVAQNLAELLTNSVNMTTAFYDLFINPEPMDVTLYQYDENNELIAVVVPNRAKSNQIVLSGTGTPEGYVTAALGTCYVDITTQKLYAKVSGSGNTGWVQIITGNWDLNDFVPKTTAINGHQLFSDIDLTASDVGALSINTLYGKSLNMSSDILILRDQNGNNLSSISLGNIGANKDLSNLNTTGEAHFANPSLSNLNTTGEAHFANPSLSNLNTAGAAVLAAKENISNKVTSISSSSTDTQYPSAKLVYNQLAAKENISNKVTSISSSSTDTQYPSAKAVYNNMSTITYW